MYKTLFVLFFLLNSEIVFSQNRFDNFLQETNLVYTEPEGFLETENGQGIFSPDKRKTISLIMKVLISADREVAIGLSLLPIVPYVKNPHISNEVYTQSEMFYNHIKALADTSIHRVYEYDKEKLSGITASRGAKFDVGMKYYSYLDKYTHCRIVLIQQNYTGEAFISYFYTDSSEAKVEKVIEDTWGLLRFNDEKKYKSKDMNKEGYEFWKKYKRKLKRDKSE